MDVGVEKLINFSPIVEAYKSMAPKWRAIAIASVIAIFLDLTYFIFFAIPWSKMGVAEWAYWVGAIGSISAIAGSLGVAGFQAKEARKVRRIEALENRHTVGQMALRLAIDTVLCLDNTRGRIEDRRESPRNIGHERLDQLQASLHSFANKNIPAEILSELLVLQREVAFTKMSIRELGVKRPSDERIKKANRRTNRVIRSREAIRNIAKKYKTDLLFEKD